jgi:photosystem II stability/assembly factor-like uncharacterized protein
MRDRFGTARAARGRPAPWVAVLLAVVFLAGARMAWASEATDEDASSVHPPVLHGPGTARSSEAEYRTPIGKAAPFTYDGWEPLGPGEAGGLQAILPHPTDPSIVLAGSDSLGLQLSRDGGKTWKVVNRGLRGRPPMNSQGIYPMAWDPRRPNVVYAARAGLVVKSTDGGETWVPPSRNMPARWPPVLGLTLDPHDSGVLYAVLWDGQVFVSRDQARSFTELASLPLGEAKTVGRWFSGRYLDVDPESAKDRRTLYAASPLGLAKSTDGGRSWQIKKVGEHGAAVNNVQVVPSFENGKTAIVVACNSVPYTDAEIAKDPKRRGMAKFAGGVHVSFDGGKTFEARHQGLPVARARVFSLLHVHAKERQTLFVSTVRGGGHSIGAFRSNDGGRSWQLSTRRVGKDRNMTFGWMSPDVEDFSVARGSMIDLMVFEGSAADPDLLFLRGSGRTGIMKSTDRGESWKQIYADPVPGRPGFWRGRGANLAYVHSVGFDPNDPAVIFVNFSDFGSHVSFDSGRTWRRFYNVHWHGPGGYTTVRWPGGPGWTTGDDIRKHIRKVDPTTRREHPTSLHFDGSHAFGITVDPDDSAILYVLPRRTGTEWPASGALLKSTDRGESYTIKLPTVEDLGRGVKCALGELALDPRGTPATRRLYAAADRCGVYVSDDAGRSWAPSTDGIPRGEVILHVALSPSQPDTVLVASGTNASYRKKHTNRLASSGMFGRIYRSDDRGQAWRRIFDGPADVHQILVHPDNPDIVYAVVSNHGDRASKAAGLLPGGVYRTTDGGQSWRRTFSQPAVTALAIRPDEPDTLFTAVREVAIGSHGRSAVPDAKAYQPGLYRTRDGGETWQDVSGALTELVTGYLHLAINPADPEVLYVGTTGGLWRRRIP